jgi:hypothetical protein
VREPLYVDNIGHIGKRGRRTARRGHRRRDPRGPRRFPLTQSTSWPSAGNTFDTFASRYSP